MFFKYLCICLFIISGFLYGKTKGQNNNLMSPCPEIFQYRYNGDWYGFIQIPSPRLGQTIKLTLFMTLRAQLVNNDVGSIELSVSRAAALQNLMNNKPTTYKVRFPFSSPLPKVTLIKYNNQVICSGPIDLAPHTRIRLEHVLYSSLMASQQGQPNFNINSANDQQQNQNNQPTIDFYKPKVPITNPQINFVNEPNYYNFDNENHNHNTQNTQNTQENQNKPDYLFLNGNQFVNTDDTINNQENSNNDFGTSINLNPSQPVIINPPQELEDPFNFNTQITRKPFIRESTTTTTTTTPPPTTTSTPPMRATTTTILPDDTPDRFLESLTDDDICGVPDKRFSVTQLVVGGTPIRKGAWPWLVAIYTTDQNSLAFQCGGNLISSKVVLTAAHCILTARKRYQAHEIVVHLGRYNIRKWTGEEGTKLVDAAIVVTHPDYMKGLDATYDADIAVIVMTDSVKYTEYIRPICLWKGVDESLVNQEGWVVGWGRDENGQTVTPEPRRTITPIVSDSMCLRSSDTFRYITSNRTFCAGKRDGTGPCNGDSGSGMAIQRNSRWTLKGLVSLAVLDPDKNICNLSEYVVYTDVVKFMEWIISFTLL